MSTENDTSEEWAEGNNLHNPGGESTELAEEATEQEPRDEEAQPGGQEASYAAPFAGTHLEGRTPEEIRSYMSLLEQTVREQSGRLTKLEEERNTQTQQAADDDSDFFTDPRAVIRRELEQVVKPINDQIAEFRVQGRVNAAWEAIRQEIPDFPTYEVYVKQILAGQNISPANVTVDLLRSLYYTAVGYVKTHGVPQTSENRMGHPQQPTVRQTPSVGIPQHRPSSAPLPSAEASKPKVRKLTESEARIAREWGMTPEQYLSMQEADAESVITLDLGGDNG